jgi:hypothetical protein
MLAVHICRSRKAIQTARSRGLSGGAGCEIDTLAMRQAVLSRTGTSKRCRGREALSFHVPCVMTCVRVVWLFPLQCTVSCSPQIVLHRFQSYGPNFFGILYN